MIMNVLEKISEIYHLDKFNYIQGSWMYKIQTPAHVFINIIKAILNEDYYVLITARDFFDKHFAKKMFKVIESNKNQILTNRSITLIENFHCYPYEFDCIAVINGNVHQKFEAQYKLLDSKIFVAFPIFKCEFSGDESPEIINTLRHDFVSTLDWQRLASPKILMRYKNTKTGSRSIGKKLKLAKFDILIREIDELTDSEDSYIEIKNYKYQFCKIILSSEKYIIFLDEKEKNKIILEDKEDLIDWIKIFISKS